MRVKMTFHELISIFVYYRYLRKRDCPEGEIMYGGHCVYLGSHDDCSQNLVVTVDPFGRPMCGCPESMSYSKERGCDFDIALKSLFTFATVCEDGTALDFEGNCVDELG